MRPNLIFRFLVGNSPVACNPIHFQDGRITTKENEDELAQNPLTTWKHTVVLLPRMESKFFCSLRQFHDLKNVPWRSWREIKDWLGNSAGTRSLLDTQVALHKRVIWVILQLFSWEFLTQHRKVINEDRFGIVFYAATFCRYCSLSGDHLRCSGNEGGGSGGVRSPDGRHHPSCTWQLRASWIDQSPRLYMTGVLLSTGMPLPENKATVDLVEVRLQ